MQVSQISTIEFILTSDDIDDEVEVAFNDGGETKDSRNRSNQESDPKMSETQRRRRGKGENGIRNKSKPLSDEKEQASIMEQLCSFWSVLTFSWMRPLLVVGMFLLLLSPEIKVYRLLVKETIISLSSCTSCCVS